MSERCPQFAGSFFTGQNKRAVPEASNLAKKPLVNGRHHHGNDVAQGKKKVLERGKEKRRRPKQSMFYMFLCVRRMTELGHSLFVWAISAVNNFPEWVVQAKKSLKGKRAHPSYRVTSLMVKSPAASYPVHR